MISKTNVRRGEYYDSVTLLQIAQELMALDGIIDAAVVMGTPANKGILENADLLTAEAEAASADDLVIAVRAETEARAMEALAEAEAALKASNTPRETAADGKTRPKTVAAAVGQIEAANITLISVAGQYAAGVAREALQHDTHVFLFSDNVSLENEIALKKMGRDRGLLVMGPDAGTAIINGVALGFANRILQTPPTPGGVGVVAAAGTGLQAVTCELTRRHVGVTQAIGTGGRDLSADVGGIMMLEGLKALQADPETRVILLVSKPPARAVARTILERVKRGGKPTVVCFLGGKRKPVEAAGAVHASTLERAAVIAATLATEGEQANVDQAIASLKKRNKGYKERAKRLRAQLMGKQRYFRGLFSGGTFCYETQLILNKMLGGQSVLSNAPVTEGAKLKDASVSQGHTAVDLGEDEFTVGRLHPMLDPTLRNRRILQEAQDPSTAIIYLDIVLGYGVHPDPAGAALEAIREAKSWLEQKGRTVHFLAHVCGTDGDPQNATLQEEKLRQEGVIVLPTNAAATRMAGYILR